MQRNQRILRFLAALGGVFVAATLLVSASANGSSGKSRERARTPVVMFPAYFFTTLRVNVHHQTVAPECPRSGSFRVFFLNDEPTSFSTVCQMKLLTLRYDAKRGKPISRRFSDQHGVDVRIENYGNTESAPFYEPMYEAPRGSAMSATGTFGSRATTRGSLLTCATSSTGRSG
jgi:lecithin-cholesterol acyltransferase